MTPYMHGTIEIGRHGFHAPNKVEQDAHSILVLYYQAMHLYRSIDRTFPHPSPCPTLRMLCRRKLEENSGYRLPPLYTFIAIIGPYYHICVQ